MDIFDQECEIAFLECSNAIQSSTNLFLISSYEEDGEGNSKINNMLARIRQKIQNLFEAVKTFLMNLFGKNDAGRKDLERKIKEKGVENKKVECLDSKKLYALTSSYKRRIENAKSNEEILSIMSEYETKQKNCIATMAAIASLSVMGVSIALTNKFKKEWEVADAKYSKEMTEHFFSYKSYSKMDTPVKKEWGKATAKLSAAQCGEILGAYGAVVSLCSIKYTKISELYSSALHAIKRENGKTVSEINKL